MVAAGGGNSMAVDTCARIVEATTKSCSVPPVASPPSAGAPNWDAMASSFASLSTALTWGSILLAFAALAIGYAWMRIATREAKEAAREEAKAVAEHEARKEAKSLADAYIAKWLAEEAPDIIRAHVENLQNATLGTGDDDEAADEIGKAAG